MLKIIFVISSLALLADSCNPPPLDIKQVIEQTKQCQDAGLKASAVHSYSDLSGDAGIVRIDCEPK